MSISSKKVRKRRIGGGRKGVLNSVELKLFFGYIINIRRFVYNGTEESLI